MEIIKEIISVIFVLMVFVTFLAAIKLGKADSKFKMIMPLLFVGAIALLWFMNTFINNDVLKLVVFLIGIIIYIAVILFLFYRASTKKKTENILIEEKKQNDFHAFSVNKERNSGIKKYYITVFAVAAVLSIMVVAISLSRPRNKFEDTNGAENFSLCHISLEEIVNCSVSPSASFSAYGAYGDKSNVKGDYEDDDYDRIKYSAKVKHGTSVINSTLINNEATINFELDSKINSGNCRVIVTVDDEYYDEFDLNCIDEISVTDACGKRVLVIMAAESLNFELELNRRIGTQKK